MAFKQVYIHHMSCQKLTINAYNSILTLNRLKLLASESWLGYLTDYFNYIVNKQFVIAYVTIQVRAIAQLTR